MLWYYKTVHTFASAWHDFHCRCQRFMRGWSDSDVWDMDLWFIRTVEPMLKHLRDRGCAIPNDLYDETDDTRDPWEDVLTEMIKCVHLMDRENARMALGVKSNTQMSNLERERMNKLMDKNKEHFFELFNKYFWELWG